VALRFSSTNDLHVFLCHHFFVTPLQGDQIRPSLRAASDCKITKMYSSFLGYFIQWLSVSKNFDSKWVGLHFGRLFLKLIWSPCSSSRHDQARQRRTGNQCYEFTYESFPPKTTVKTLAILTQNTPILLRMLTIGSRSRTFSTEN
jgi:hypothetical protein